MANELSTNHGNALAITQQYPEEKYNLLVPIKTVAEIAEIHKPVMNVVYISTNEKDGEIYLQDKRNGGYALTKKALTKLMKAAGIKIIDSRPLLPTKCEKCAAVNRSVGRPVPCGTCPNKDVKHQVVIRMPQLTGEDTEVIGTKEILYDDVTGGMSQLQKAEFSKFRSEMCETKALLRALRIAMQIKATYTKNELEKPFVVAYLVPNLDNPEVKEKAIEKFFGAARELYGVIEEAAGARRVVYADNHISDDDDGYEPPMPEEIPETMEQPQEVYQPQPEPQRQAQMQPPQEAEEVTDPTVCQRCGKKLSDGVINYSVKNFGKPYCMSCQKEIQNGR